MKVVIVGGVAGGASAAARIRRLNEHAQIIMIERSGYVSYANYGLPYYVGGVIKEQEELTLQTPESFWDRFRIDVRVRQEVTAINPTEKTVTVHALDSGKIYTETYDKLLLAPGAKPSVPALSGVSSEGVFTLRTVEDTLRIRRFVEEQKPKTAVLAGGGFIGLEMAENLVEMGVSVTIVQRPKQLLAPLDTDMASFVHAEMRRHGVALRLGETVTGFRQDGNSVLTLLDSSEPLHSDMVLLAIGVTPDPSQCACHHIREYRYAYGAVEPLTGDGYFLVLPYCNTVCMNIFLKQLSEKYADDIILLCCDGAAWHRSAGLELPDNIVLFHIPPYTPEMNPIEQIWKEIRKRGFRNEIFATLEKVVDRLCDTICSLNHEIISSITGRE